MGDTGHGMESPSQLMQGTPLALRNPCPKSLHGIKRSQLGPRSSELRRALLRLQGYLMKTSVAGAGGSEQCRLP